MNKPLYDEGEDYPDPGEYVNPLFLKGILNAINYIFFL